MKNYGPWLKASTLHNSGLHPNKCWALLREEKTRGYIFRLRNVCSMKLEVVTWISRSAVLLTINLCDYFGGFPVTMTFMQGQDPCSLWFFGNSYSSGIVAGVLQCRVRHCCMEFSSLYSEYKMGHSNLNLFPIRQALSSCTSCQHSSTLSYSWFLGLLVRIKRTPLEWLCLFFVLTKQITLME